MTAEKLFAILYTVATICCALALLTYFAAGPGLLTSGLLGVGALVWLIGGPYYAYRR